MNKRETYYVEISEFKEKEKIKEFIQKFATRHNEHPLIHIRDITDSNPHKWAHAMMIHNPWYKIPTNIRARVKHLFQFSHTFVDEVTQYSYFLLTDNHENKLILTYIDSKTDYYTVHFTYSGYMKQLDEYLSLLGLDKGILEKVYTPNSGEQ